MQKKFGFTLAFLMFLPWIMLAQNTIKRQVSGFTKISVYGDIVVYLTKGKTEALEIDIPDDLKPNQITTVVENGELTIKSTYGLLKDNKKIKAYLTYKTLNSLSAGGSGELNIPDSVLKTDRLVLNAYTGGTIDLTVDVQSIVADVSEKAVIAIDGYSNSEEITASLAGVYSAYDLEAEDGTAKAASNAIVKVHCTMKLEATANTGGWVGYTGDPKYKFFTPKLGGKIEKIEDNEK
jgi:hypothetical protein